MISITSCRNFNNFFITTFIKTFKLNNNSLVGLSCRPTDYRRSALLFSTNRQTGLRGNLMLKFLSALILFSSLTFLKTQTSNGAWVAQTSGTTTNIWGTHFTDLNTGWIIGESGLIRRTTDGGNTWST